MLLTAVSLLSLLLFTALVLVYATRSDIPHMRKLQYTADEVSVLVRDTFDLRYYDRLELNLTSDDNRRIFGDIIVPYIFNASLCQINCPDTAVEDEQLVTTVPINYTRSFVDMKPRKFVRFNNDVGGHTPNIFVVKESEIEFWFEAVAAQRGSSDGEPNITLNWFCDLSQCRDFQDTVGTGPDSTTHLQLRDSGPVFRSYSNFSVGSEKREYVCVVVELSPGFNYTYTVRGMARQFRSATSLHNDINTRCVQYNSSRLSLESNVEFTLKRPLKSKSSTESQKTCVLVTLKKVEQCPFGSCNLNLCAVLHYAPENVRVAALSAWGVLSLLSLSAFLVVSVVVCYKCS